MMNSPKKSLSSLTTSKKKIICGALKKAALGSKVVDPQGVVKKLKCPQPVKI
jgi:hypothetical protein